MRRRRWGWLLVAALVLGACTSSDDAEPAPTTTTPAPIPSPDTPSSFVIEGSPSIPRGEPDQFSIVMALAPSNGLAQAVVHNRTEAAVVASQLAAEVRGADGSLVESDLLVSLFPAVVEPNEWGVVSVQVGFDTPDSASLHLNVSDQPDAAASQRVTLAVTELSFDIHEGRFVGTIENSSSTPAQAAQVSVACFDRSGRSLDWVLQSAMSSFELPAGGSAAFTTSATFARGSGISPAGCRHHYAAVAVGFVAVEGSSSTVVVSSGSDPTDDVALRTSPLVFVSGELTVAEGEAGRLSIHQAGPPQGGIVPVVIRNRTTHTLHSLRALGTVRNATGSVFASAESDYIYPAQLAPGEWSHGYIHLHNFDLPDGSMIDLDVRGFSREIALMPRVEVASAGLVVDEGGQTVARVSNPSDRNLAGPVSLLVSCFDPSGVELVDLMISPSTFEPLPPGGSLDLALPSWEAPCEGPYAMGAYSWAPQPSS